MIALPHDTSDLLLAPMLLGIDANIDRLSALPLDELAIEIAVISNVPDRTRIEREEGLTKTVCENVECHDWELTWVPRGLCVSHHNRRVVLGAPPHFADYLDGNHRAARAG